MTWHIRLFKYLVFYILLALLAFSPLAWFSLTGNDIPQSDGLENMQAAYVFYHNLLPPGTPDPGYDPDIEHETTREPLYPYTVALALRIYAGADLKTQGYRCFTTLGLCPDAIIASKHVNWLFNALSIACAGIFTLLLTGSGLAGLIIAAIMSFDSVLITAANSWFSESPALLFLLIHGGFLYASCSGKIKNIRLCAGISGVALAFLILTKAIFLYLPLLYLGAGVFIYMANRITPDAFRRTHAAMMLTIAATALAPVIPVLKHQNGGHDLSTTRMERGGVVLAIRAEYDIMPWADILPALAYFTPEIGPKYVRARWGAETAARFDRENSQSYYRRVKNRQGAAYELSKNAGISLQAAAFKIIGQNWLKHAALTPVFAYEGLFIPRKIAPDNYKCAASKFLSFAVNYTLLPLCMLGCFYLIRNRRWDYLLLMVPISYSFAMHAFLTHYWPRYSVPLLGIGLVFLSICVHFALSQRKIRNASPPFDLKP